MMVIINSINPKTNFKSLASLLIWGTIILNLGCRPNSTYQPTAADKLADFELQRELKAIVDCVNEICQPTDEEKLEQTALNLLNALICADILQASNFATDEALGAWFYIDIANIEDFEIKIIEVFKNRGVVTTYLNSNTKTCKITFSRKHQDAPWIMISVK